MPEKKLDAGIGAVDWDENGKMINEFKPGLSPEMVRRLSDANEEYKKILAELTAKHGAGNFSLADIRALIPDNPLIKDMSDENFVVPAAKSNEEIIKEWAGGVEKKDDEAAQFNK